MALAVYANYTSSLAAQSHALGTLQTAGVLNERSVTRLGTSRLFQDSNGSIQLIEKTPAEVIGEKILRPLIDKMSALTSYVSSFAQYLPSLPSLPVAYAKEARVSDGTMHFPSQKVLVSCLDKHPLTGKQVTRYLSEKGVTESIAESFADTDKVPMGVDLGVMLGLYDLNEKLQLPDIALATMQMNLVEALKDCAAGDEIPVNSATYNDRSDL